MCGVRNYKVTRTFAFTAIALVAALLFFAISFSGCNSKPTAESLIKKASSKDESNMSMDMDMDTSYSAPYGFGQRVRISGPYWLDDLKTHSELLMETEYIPSGDSTITWFDTSEGKKSQEIEMYGIIDNDKMRTYVTPDGDSWYFSDQEYDSEANKNSFGYLYFDGIEWSLAEETENIDGHEAYVLTANIPFYEQMFNSTYSSLSGSTEEILNMIDPSKISVDTKIWIDAAKDGGLLRAELDFGDSFFS